WDAAVAQAKEAAAKIDYDGIHGLPVNQAQGLIQAQDGTLSITPLVGHHRERLGPLFVDGMFFDRTALSLQMTHADPALVAIVGASHVFDLRENGA
ncbi:hypothetical protein, partial [Rhizobium leguminosarum]|uniref:hypothetical protein n=1 Tax=Rhizobium leguminosarum TaxID=384 RepID=UPI003F9E2AD5